MGKVADRRAAAKKAGQSMKQYKAANNIKPKSSSSKSSSKSSPRAGSVAANRAAGTNKAAGGPGKSASSSGGSNKSQAKERSQNRRQRILQSGEGGRANKFDRKDIAALRDKGWSDKKLARVSGKLNRNQQTGASQKLTGYKDATQTGGDIKKYDPNSIGNQKNNKYSVHDVQALKGQGYSKMDLGKHFYELGDDANLGARAQKLKNKYVSSLTKSNDDPQPEVGEITQPGIQEPATQEPPPQLVTNTTGPRPTSTNTVTFAPPSIPVSTPTVTMPSMPGIESPTNVNPVQDNDQSLQVAQNNPLTQTVVGDGNYTYATQDNSIRQYGGDNRQFTYVSSGDGKYGGDHLETPASMATLGGFYDVDDSPAKQAKFLDLHTTLNRDNQKKYAHTGHIAQGAIHRAGMNQAVDMNALDTRLHNREMYSRAKSDVMGMHLFGDMYGYTPPKYQMPEPQKPVEQPNVGQMYEDYTDFK